MTWIGRSIHCASSIATSVEISSATSDDRQPALAERLRSSLRTSSVDTPMRIDAELLVAGEQRLAELEACARR